MAYYNKTSPYFSTSLENNYLNVIDFRDIPAQPDDVLFTVTKNYEYRPDLLAFDLYNDVTLWWVFSVRNKSILKDPVFDMVAGKKIFLPKVATLRSVLGI